MKRLLTVILVFALCLGLGACGSDSIHTPFSFEWDSGTISRGMPLSEMPEDLTEQGSSIRDGRGAITYNEGITIVVRDDIVVMANIPESSGFDITSSFDIKFGDTKEAVIKKLGQATIDNASTTMAYYYKNENDALVLLSETELNTSDIEDEELLGIVFLLDDDKITTMRFGDRLSLTTFA